MNRISNILGSAVLGLTALVAAGNLVSPSTADAATSTSCSFVNGLQWGCELSNPDGFESVHLTWHSPFGDIELVDETYAECPTEVTIGNWGDNVAGDFTLDVQACEREDAPAGGNLGFKSTSDGDSSGGSTRFKIGSKRLSPILR